MPTTKKIEMLFAVFKAVGVEHCKDVAQLLLLAAVEAFLLHGSSPLGLLNHTPQAPCWQVNCEV